MHPRDMTLGEQLDAHLEDIAMHKEMQKVEQEERDAIAAYVETLAKDCTAPEPRTTLLQLVNWLREGAHLNRPLDPLPSPDQDQEG